MRNTVNKWIYSFVIILIVISFFSCSKGDDYGRLGIVVPIGQGKVTKKTPYVITGVYENSPSYNAGIRPDDIIVQIDTVPIRNQRYDYIYNNLLRGRVGTKVTITVKRAEKIIIFQVIRGN